MASTPDDDLRLRRLVRNSHEAGLGVRLWTLNGHAPGAEQAFGWSRGYNVGSLQRVRLRWRAAVASGADFVATDLYEAFVDELRTPQTPARQSPAHPIHFR